MPSERVVPGDEDHPHPHAFAVVWTTLPGLSIFLPSIGHLGIADSAGVIRDFSGPYTVTVNKMMCGPPRRVWKLDPTLVVGGAKAFDDAVGVAARVYENRMHNIVFDNCHSHVARTLNEIRYQGRDDWNMLRVWAALWMHGKWTSTTVAIRTLLPTVVLVVLIILCVILPKLV